MPSAPGSTAHQTISNPLIGCSTEVHYTCYMIQLLIHASQQYFPHHTLPKVALYEGVYWGAYSSGLLGGAIGGPIRVGDKGAYWGA